MYGRNNGQWSFVDMLTLFDTFLQMADFEMNVRQSSNDDIMRELGNQNKIYLEKIVENQNEILSILKDIQNSPKQADTPHLWVDYMQRARSKILALLLLHIDN